MVELEDIKDPKDLHGRNIEELKGICSQLRSKIIEVVSETGGHLASNLGVVELTVALHSVFSSPRDKIVWDVGHQCYAHKLLSGRQKSFSTLRQLNGLSGFPKPSESPHDCVETGHSSTSLSAALGLAISREQKGEDHEVIGIIGDGALTGGMALEALNHIGHMESKVIVVLNDNEMSISKNVGALANHLGRLRTDPFYQKLRSDLEIIMKRIPAIGDRVAFAADRVKDSLKYLVLPGVFFEELGFTYLGPVPGHNLKALQEYFKRCKKLKGPILIHTVTEKGKGYPPAEKNPAKFHGPGPFKIETGESKKKAQGKKYSEVFGEIICELGKKDKKVNAISAAMPDGTGLVEFSKKFPDRFFDVGIAEQHAVTLASGMAREGLKPFVAIYSTFLQRAYDQIIHDVCLPDLPVVFAVDRAGVVGEDGETHQGLFDLSFFRHIPNMTVMAPRDRREMEKMFDFALEHQGPVAVRYPRGVVPEPAFFSDESLNYGTSEVLRSGEDVLLLTLGSTVWPGYQVAQNLEKKGISTCVVDLRFLKPLDEKTLQKVLSRVKVVVTAEENYLSGGMGSAVLEAMARLRITKPVINLGMPDSFIPHGKSDDLMSLYELDVKGMTRRIERFWNEYRGRNGKGSFYEKEAGSFAGGKRGIFFKK